MAGRSLFGDQYAGKIYVSFWMSASLFAGLSRVRSSNSTPFGGAYLPSTAAARPFNRVMAVRQCDDCFLFSTHDQQADEPRILQNVGFICHRWREPNTRSSRYARQEQLSCSLFLQEDAPDGLLIAGIYGLLKHCAHGCAYGRFSLLRPRPGADGRFMRRATCHSEGYVYAGTSADFGVRGRHIRSMQKSCANNDRSAVFAR
jgi:hypothetical protein